MKIRAVFFLFLLTLALLPFSFVAKMKVASDDPFRLAIYYDSLAMPDSALYWLQKSNTISFSGAHKIKHHLLMAGQLRQLRRNDEAWAYYDNAVRLLSNENNAANMLAEAEFLKGRLLYDKGDYSAAIQSFDAAKELLGAHNALNIGLMVRILNFKGIAHYFLGEFSVATSILKNAEALVLASNAVNPLDYGDVLQNLAIMYSNLSLLDSAYIYISKARAIKENTFRQDHETLVSF